MAKFMIWLSGKKTHLNMAAVILTAIAAFASGQLDGTQLLMTVFGALGFSSMRAGVSKIGK